MKNSTRFYLSRLVRAHGSYSQTARTIGITPSYMRRIRRENMPSSCSRMLLTEGKLLLLRNLLRELRSSGVLTTAALSSAWKALRADSSDREKSPYTHVLPHSSATAPRQ